MENVYIFKGHGAKDWALQGLNKLLEKLQETGTTARRSGSIKSMQNLSFFNSVIFIHKLDTIRKEYVIWLQFFSAAIVPNIIKIGSTFD